MKKTISLGHGNYIAADIICAIGVVSSAPIKRKLEEAKKNNKILDMTFGRRTKSVIFTSDGTIILCGLTTDTLSKRINE